jgi:methionyl aminopeptidase
MSIDSVNLAKTVKEQDLIRKACQVASLVLYGVARRVVPGITTIELDEIAAELIKRNGARSAFLGYNSFPRHSCISVNNEVVHGLGSNKRLEYGDIVGLDVGVVLDGYIGDIARTVPVGGCSVEAQRLIDVTEMCLYKGIEQAVAGKRVSDISRAVQFGVESNGFSVVREYVGHGVGRSMHEEPQIPNFVENKASPKLLPGMTIAIEPMVNAGLCNVKVAEDGWTVVTQDGSLSAHFEHTVLVTYGLPEILTWHEIPV